MTALAELEAIAANEVRPTGHVTVVLVEAGTTGDRLPNGSFSGIGGTTRYGPAWFDGLRKSAPIALFERQYEARVLADLLDHGSTLRTAPDSVAGARQHAGSVETGAVPSADDRIGRRRSSSRTLPRPLAEQPDGVTPTDSTPPVERDAGSPGAPLDTHSEPGPLALGVAPISSAAAAGVTVADDDGTPGLVPDPTPSPNRVDQADGDPAGSGRAIAQASPGSKRCAACGRDLSFLPQSPMSGRRRTCSTACRQAYRRGHRAPVAGAVDEDTVERLSRLGTRILSGFGHGDPEPEPDPAQLAIALPSADPDDDLDLRPKGTVNFDALRGEALRSLLDEVEA